jgi:UDP-N-acetylmuramoyl-L-alanyl-D-glutamate--2,6-diaminopimelate ligase
MSKIVEDTNSKVLFFGNYNPDNLLDISYKEGVGIYCKDELYVEEKELPFTSAHFIQDIMAALAVVTSLEDIKRKDIIESLRNYKPLARRFIRLKDSPVIIDDFAHNPSGIKLTIENGAKLGNNLFVVDAIRGSRGEDINREIAEALSEVLGDRDNYTLVLTCSVDVVNHLNTVLDSELKIFLDTLDKDNIQYTLIESLEEALINTINQASDDDVILLLGAQGMDPASDLLRKNNIIE